MELNEALSRLSSGELIGPEADALRERIRTEPEVAAAWARICAIPDAIAALPVPPGMPDLAAGRVDAPPRQQALDALVAPDARAPRTNRPALVWWLLPLAALGAGYLIPHPRPHVVLAGEAVVEGPVVVDLGARSIRIDGRSRVRVEPRPALVHGEEVAPMDKTHLFSALAGAALTLVVEQGSATIEGGGDRQTLSAGERLDPPKAATPPAR